MMDGPNSQVARRHLYNKSENETEVSHSQNKSSHRNKQPKHGNAEKITPKSAGFV